MLPAVGARTLLIVVLSLSLLVNAISVVVRLLVVPPGGEALGPGPFSGRYQLLAAFNADGEGNVTTWVAASVLLLIALVAFGLGREMLRQGKPWRRHWIALGVIFSYLSLDEAAQLHELAIPRMAQVVDATGVLTYAWIALAAPLVLAFVIVYLPVLLSLPLHVGRWLLTAGVLYVGGALGMEMVGGWLIDAGYSYYSAAYIWATSIEEGLEMAGACLCLYALARYAEGVVAGRRAPYPSHHAHDPAPST